MEPGAFVMMPNDTDENAIVYVGEDIQGCIDAFKQGDGIR
jgi:hypothetical protein